VDMKKSLSHLQKALALAKNGADKAMITKKIDGIVGKSGSPEVRKH